MKRKNALFILGLILFVCVSGCDILNPVVDPWWEGADEPPGYLFTQEQFVVSFDSGGGNYVDSINGNSPSASPQRVWAHAHASVPGLVAKANSYFNGWYKTQTGGAKWDFAKNQVVSDMTLYAQWSGSGYTVDFNINFPVSGFDEKANLTYVPLREYIAKGALAAEPLQFGLKSGTAYVREYVFIGWYRSKTAADTMNPAGKWDFATDTVTKNEILYAGWAEVTNPRDVYTVTFISDADINPPPNQYVMKDKLVIAPYVTFRNGSSFGGWYTDAAYTRAWVFNVDTADSAHAALDGTTDNTITLYAKWAPVAAVDVLKDLDIVQFRYILFSGGQEAYNGGAAQGSSTNLTTAEKTANDGEIAQIAACLNANPNYRVMIVGHANPATEADKANPQNAELMALSKGRADAVEARLVGKLGSQYDYLVKTPIIVRSEGGRKALTNPMLSRRVEIIVFDIITTTVTQ